MEIIRIADKINKEIGSKKANGFTVGFVPTMGALHPGHLSLINQSLVNNDLTVCSIFVNPTQFNDPADFEKYPVTIEEDILLLEKTGCNFLFLPTVSQVYPNGLKNLKQYDLGHLETILEGKFRPGHFQGVCQVVHRLLEITMPDNLYLGQKDYQQCMIIKRLVEIMGISEKIKVSICPTQREANGLAMSSRNKRLSDGEKKLAESISTSLQMLKENIQPGSVTNYIKEAMVFLLNKGFKIDYIEIADAETLEIKTEWDGKEKLVALVAVFLNEVRLIDNMLIRS